MPPTPFRSRDGHVGVPFAVIGDPGSDQLVEAPDTQREMIELDRAVRGKNLEFYCAAGAGGCGEPLSVAAGPVRRPYFRHYPGTLCTVTDGGEFVDRCTHRLIQNELVRWLQSLGHESRPEHYLDRRSRVDVFCAPGAVIEVQLSGETYRSMEDRTARYGGNVTWLYGPQSAISSRDTALNAEGVVQLVRLRPGPADQFGRGRRVDIGIRVFGEAEINWSPLRGCSFDSTGGLRSPEFLPTKQRIERERKARVEAEAIAERRRVAEEATRAERERLAVIARREAAVRHAEARRLKPQANVRAPVMPVLPWGDAPGPHPAFLGERRVIDWELRHHPLFAHRKGAWWTAAVCYPDEFGSWASHVDGSWTAGLPGHLTDAAWAALFWATNEPVGLTSSLVDTAVDPSGVIVRHLVERELITISSADGLVWQYRM